MSKQNIFRFYSQEKYNICELNKDVFIDKIKGHYCMLGTSVGSLMCYFSNSCSLVEDSSTGIRSLIAHGRIELILA